MQYVALAELMVSRGGTVNPAMFANELFDLYSIPAFDRGASELVTGADIGSTKQVVRPGDVLLSKIVPHLRRSWIVGENRGSRLIASGEWIVFRHPDAHPPYLRHVLVGDAFHAHFMATVSGVGGSLLRARPAFVAKIKIPLPHLQEQRRIADILDRADALRAKRREALAHLDELTKSIFLDMFGDPQSNPMDWPRAELGSYITAGPTNGLYKPSSDYGSGTPIVRIDSFYNGVVMALGSLKRLALSEADLVRFALRADDVLVNRVNSLEYLGKCAVVPELREPTVFESNIMRLRLDVTMLAPRYAVDFLCSDYVRDQIRSSAKRAVNQASINQKDVRSFQINVPPLGLQSDYVRRRSVVEQAAARQRLGLQLQDEVFVSLQQQAFAGQL